jgi:hypothetical protein
MKSLMTSGHEVAQYFTHVVPVGWGLIGDILLLIRNFECMG